MVTSTVCAVVVTAIAATSGCGGGSDPDATAGSATGAVATADPGRLGDDRSSEDSVEPDPPTDDTIDSDPDADPDQDPDDPTPTGTRPSWAPTDLGTEPGPTPTWTVEVLDARPHDPAAFTQGLELHDGTLYESTGLVGESTIRTVDVESGEVTASVDVDPEIFAEGLTVTDDQVVQLTFRAGIAYVRDPETLEQVDEHRYEGEGWGICRDGDRLVMSNGSATLAVRDPSSFEVVESVEVTLDGEPVTLLNELECVDGYVLANVWMTDTVVVIDPGAGRVVATIYASSLTLDAVDAETDGGRVLNGIARLDDTTFLLTGKLWPTMYRVRFVAA